MVPGVEGCEGYEPTRHAAAAAEIGWWGADGDEYRREHEKGKMRLRKIKHKQKQKKELESEQESWKKKWSRRG